MKGSKICPSCGEMRKSAMFSALKDHFVAKCKPCAAMSYAMRCEHNDLGQQSTGARPTAKICQMCSKMLPRSSFHSRRAMKDGLRGICRACHSKNSAATRKMRNELFGSHPPIASLAQERICSRCKSILPWTDFPRDRTRMFGFKSQCKGCERIKKRVRLSSIRPS